MPSVCKSCKAPIRWVLMDSGKRNPLDPEPSAKGNVVLDGESHLGETRGVVLTGDELEHARAQRQALYLSHFATCPYADIHRNKEK